MAAVDGLAEVAGRAAQAESMARSVAWQDRTAVDAAAAKVSRSLAQDRIALAQPGLSAVEASATWRHRLAELVDPQRDAQDDPPPDDPVLAAARAQADAETAVAVARLALIEAHRAALDAQRAALRAGDSEAASAVIRGLRPLPPGNLMVRHGQALGGGVADEVTTVLHRRPRSILIKLAIGLGLGLAYLAFLRVFQWEDKAEILPYLAPYALSGVIGGVVCTNALSWDAGRVRSELTSGRRLWHLLLSKNFTMFLLVGAAGLLLCVLLAYWAGEPGALIKSLGELVTLMLIWLGIGNVLSVLSPLRVEPLRERFKDGTIKPFLLSFLISYVVGLGVNLMLTWRVWAKQTMIENLGGPWIPVLLLVCSALMVYLLLTVLAVGLADQPRVRRELLREMIDYKAVKAAQVGGAQSHSASR